MADYRFTNNDPNYERTQGLRNARTIGFFASIVGWLGIFVTIGGIVVEKQEVLLLGLASLGAWLLLKVVSKFFYIRFRD